MVDGIQDPVSGYDDTALGIVQDIRHTANKVGRTPTRTEVVDYSSYTRHQISKRFFSWENARLCAGVQDWSRRTIATWMADKLDDVNRNHARSRHIKKDVGMNGTTVGSIIKDACGDTMDPWGDRPPINVERYNKETTSNCAVWYFEYAGQE